MIIIAVKPVSEAKVNLHIKNSSKDTIRKFPVVIGQEYVVEPLNAHKKKHRDRRVVVRGFEKDFTHVKVQFVDNQRPGKVEFGDLNTIDHLAAT